MPVMATGEEPEHAGPSASGTALGPSRLLLVLGALAVGAMALVLGLVFRPSAGPRSTSVADYVARPVAEHRAAPSFRLPSIDGGTAISSDGLTGHVVLLNFWASWCGPCREEAPALEALWRRNRGQGVRFVGVDHADSRAEGLAFRARYGVSYPSGFDPAGTLAPRFGALGLPTTFILTPKGMIAYRLLGRVDPGILGGLIDRLLGGPA